MYFSKLYHTSSNSKCQRREKHANRGVYLNLRTERWPLFRCLAGDGLIRAARGPEELLMAGCYPLALSGLSNLAIVVTSTLRPQIIRAIPTNVRPTSVQHGTDCSCCTIYPWWRHGRKWFPRKWSFLVGSHRWPMGSIHNGTVILVVIMNKLLDTMTPMWCYRIRYYC